jgi:hypothetical protein
MTCVSIVFTANFWFCQKTICEQHGIYFENYVFLANDICIGIYPRCYICGKKDAWGASTWFTRVQFLTVIYFRELAIKPMFFSH